MPAPSAYRRGHTNGSPIIDTSVGVQQAETHHHHHHHHHYDSSRGGEASNSNGESSSSTSGGSASSEYAPGRVHRLAPWLWASLVGALCIGVGLWVAGRVASTASFGSKGGSVWVRTLSVTGVMCVACGIVGFVQHMVSMTCCRCSCHSKEKAPLRSYGKHNSHSRMQPRTVQVHDHHEGARRSSSRGSGAGAGAGPSEAGSSDDHVHVVMDAVVFGDVEASPAVSPRSRASDRQHGPQHPHLAFGTPRHSRAGSSAAGSLAGPAAAPPPPHGAHQQQQQGSARGRMSAPPMTPKGGPTALWLASMPALPRAMVLVAPTAITLWVALGALVYASAALQRHERAGVDAVAALTLPAIVVLVHCVAAPVRLAAMQALGVVAVFAGLLLTSLPSVGSDNWGSWSTFVVPGAVVVACFTVAVLWLFRLCFRQSISGSTASTALLYLLGVLGVATILVLVVALQPTALVDAGVAVVVEAGSAGVVAACAVLCLANAVAAGVWPPQRTAPGVVAVVLWWGGRTAMAVLLDAAVDEAGGALVGSTGAWSLLGVVLIVLGGNNLIVGHSVLVASSSGGGGGGGGSSRHTPRTMTGVKGVGGGYDASSEYRAYEQEVATTAHSEPLELQSLSNTPVARGRTRRKGAPGGTSSDSDEGGSGSGTRTGSGAGAGAGAGASVNGNEGSSSEAGDSGSRSALSRHGSRQSHTSNASSSHSSPHARAKSPADRTHVLEQAMLSNLMARLDKMDWRVSRAEGFLGMEDSAPEAYPPRGPQLRSDSPSESESTVEYGTGVRRVQSETGLAMQGYMQGAKLRPGRSTYSQRSLQRARQGRSVSPKSSARRDGGSEERLTRRPSARRLGEGASSSATDSPAPPRFTARRGGSTKSLRGADGRAAAPGQQQQQHQFQVSLGSLAPGAVVEENGGHQPQRRSSLQHHADRPPIAASPAPSAASRAVDPFARDRSGSRSQAAASRIPVPTVRMRGVDTGTVLQGSMRQGSTTEDEESGAEHGGERLGRGQGQGQGRGRQRQRQRQRRRSSDSSIASGGSAAMPLVLSGDEDGDVGSGSSTAGAFDYDYWRRLDAENPPPGTLQQQQQQHQQSPQRRRRTSITSDVMPSSAVAARRRSELNGGPRSTGGSLLSARGSTGSGGGGGGGGGSSARARGRQRRSVLRPRDAALREVDHGATGASSPAAVF